ncbi:MAG: regulatory protein RecX [Dehalococcoidia bacterium]
MPVIVEVQVKRNGVAAVSIGSDDPVVLPLETVVLHHLREGVHLPTDQWSEVHSEGRRLLAVRKALELLSRKQRTEKELATGLARSFLPDEVEHAVERMRGLGYLDDGAWAKNYVSGPRATGRGRALLKHELGQRGVPDALAQDAIAEHDDRSAALEAASKRVRSLRSVEEPKRSRRLYDFLRRRGFSDTVARDAMKAALADASDT